MNKMTKINNNDGSMIKDRMIEFIDSKSIVKERFYEMIGMTSANFRGRARTSPINSNAIKKMIEHYPDLNLYWLITGKGEMINSSSSDTITTITDNGSDRNSNNKNSGNNIDNNYYTYPPESESKMLSVKDYEIQSLKDSIQSLRDIIDFQTKTINTLSELNEMIRNSANR